VRRGTPIRDPHLTGSGLRTSAPHCDDIIDRSAINLLRLAETVPMASITIRQLDDQLKQQLRLRAARHGRSMEDEARTILREAAASDVPSVPEIPSRHRGGLQTRLDKPAAELTELTARTAPGSGRRTVLLIVGGSIAAYKSLDLIRRLRERDFRVRCILTAAAQRFITPLAAAALSGETVFTDLFDVVAEADIGHIRLAREAGLIVVAPATADLIAKMAGGHADDLGTAVLLAADRPILIAPAMNPMMWAHAATTRNIGQLVADGIRLIGPNRGEMAESGEAGVGRMAEPLEIAAAVEALVNSVDNESLAGKRIVVTSGPTHEAIDPVRYIANRSSGKQGHAIAAAASAAGAEVVLVSGPVNVPDPIGVTTIKVETAQDMLTAVEQALPADCAVFAAAVADWRVAAPGREKIKKQRGKAPVFTLVENPDILATIAHEKPRRPRLVIGFAAETEHVVSNAQAKLERKGCDWIVANDVSPETGIMGGDRNSVHLVTKERVESWPPQSKDEVARALVARIASYLAGEW
jgi:phosphopantothenoylcysteine decarboxylase / phosphopantothenate---cysteine ligase